MIECWYWFILKAFIWFQLWKHETRLRGLFAYIILSFVYEWCLVFDCSWIFGKKCEWCCISSGEEEESASTFSQIQLLRTNVNTIYTVWGTGIRGLMRGMATVPRGNQELLVVRDKVGRPPGELGVSMSIECEIFPFSALTLLVGWQEGDPACKKTGCWFVGGDDLLGALHDLELH